MKAIFAAAFAALFAMSAHAEPTAEIFAAAGCDVANIVPVMSESGEVLYWTNTNGGGCLADRGDTGAAIRADQIARDEALAEEMAAK